jgi:DNA-binding XRE family transcriptional regulator
VEIFVHALLGDVGELLLPDERHKESVEEALDLLRTGGVLKTVEWPDGFGPGDIDRSKGWTDRWLNARIRVMTVSSRRAESGSVQASCCYRKRRDRRNSVQLIGTEIRFARTNIGPHWTQQELARELGISRRHLSQIETGKRKPALILEARLRDWLESRKEKEKQSELN